jgi:predicted nucleotidyltransferase
MEAALSAQRDAIAELCRTHGVLRLEVFGSAVDGSFDPQRSDYDFIARFADLPQTSLARRFIDFGDALERLLGRSVDLMTDHPIENPYLRAAVQATRTTLYDESAAKASV